MNSDIQFEELFRRVESGRIDDVEKSAWLLILKDVKKDDSFKIEEGVMSIDLWEKK